MKYRPRPNHDELKSVVKILAVAGIEPTLVGGQAVMLSNVPEFDPDATDAIADPRFLAGIIRATADVDFVVKEDRIRAAVEALEANGFAPSYPRSLHFQRQRTEVDLLEGHDVDGSADAEVSERSILVALPIRDHVVLDLDGVALASVGAATLVVLKACAVADPTRGKRQADLADLASIAIREQVHSTGAVERLRKWKATMSPGLLGRMVAVRERFSDPAREGCQAFAREVRAQVAGRLDTWDAEEQEVASVACDAVLSLLAAFRR